MTNQTKKDFKKHLKEQIEFLSKSAASYDLGYEGEAKRMAVVLNVLIHNAQRSASLLKKDILFYDTANKYHPGNPAPTIGLVLMQVGPEGAKYIPLLGDDIMEPNRKVPFQKWLDKIVIAYTKCDRLTRKDLILNAANGDVGARVDPKLDNDYANLIKFNSLGRKYDSSGDKENMHGMELASIRQIAYEVLKSLKDEFPEYF